MVKVCVLRTPGFKPHQDPSPGQHLQIHWKPESTHRSRLPTVSSKVYQGEENLTPTLSQASDNTLVKPEVRTCLEKNERGIHPIVTGVRDGTGAEQPVLRAKV